MTILSDSGSQNISSATLAEALDPIQHDGPPNETAYFGRSSRTDLEPSASHNTLAPLCSGPELEYAETLKQRCDVHDKLSLQEPKACAVDGFGLHQQVLSPREIWENYSDTHAIFKLFMLTISFCGIQFLCKFFRCLKSDG